LKSDTAGEFFFAHLLGGVHSVMESFFATLKSELIYQESFATKDEARLKIFDYIEVYYNRKRRHSSLGSKTPAEFELTAKPT